MTLELKMLVDDITAAVRRSHEDEITTRSRVADLVEGYVGKQATYLQARVRRLEGMIRSGDTCGAG